jgi:hypothetical protein
MRVRNLFFIAIALMGAVFLVGFQGSDQITRAQLRTMLVQLGYEVKDLEKEPGKEKYEIKLVTAGYNVPMGVEISPSGNYIWLTVFLKGETPSGEKAVKLLRRNAEIQPSFFYVTKSDRIMLALPVENRNVSNPVLKSRLEKVAGDVDKSADDWK